MKLRSHHTHMQLRRPRGRWHAPLVAVSCLIVLLSIVAPAAVQAQVRVGADVGANVNRLSFSKDVFSSDRRAGFFLGPKVVGTIPVIGLGFDAAALYSRMPIEINTESSAYGPLTDSKHLNYIELPINLRWELGLSLVGFYVATGPQFAWYIGNRTIRNIYNNRATVFEQHLFSWNLGAGLMLGRHVQLGASYNIPVTKAGSIRDSFDQTVEGGNLKNRTWKVRLNLFF